MLERNAAELKKRFPSRIEGTVLADNVSVGYGVVVDKDAVICGADGGKMEYLEIANFVYIGPGVRIMTPLFRIGDYSKIQELTFARGVREMQVGRNCYIGRGVILDSTGGLAIQDNVGIGAGSQLWTHIQHGDILQGAPRSHKRVVVEKDAWFVGHCLISPVRIGEASMAMMGSVVAKDMLPNHTYAGVPAVDVTAKLGSQFKDISSQSKMEALNKLISEFENRHPKHIGKLRATCSQEPTDMRVTCLNVDKRTYNRTFSDAETDFLRDTSFVKFAPEGEGEFVKL